MAPFVDSKNEITYLKWGFSVGAGMTLVMLAITFISSLFMLDGEVTATILLQFLSFINFVFIIAYTIALYIALVKVHERVPEMNAYSVALYFLLGVTVTNTLIESIAAQSFVLRVVGLIPFLLTFAVPAIFKAKTAKK